MAIEESLNVLSDSANRCRAVLLPNRPALRQAMATYRAPVRAPYDLLKPLRGFEIVKLPSGRAEILSQ